MQRLTPADSAAVTRETRATVGVRRAGALVLQDAALRALAFGVTRTRLAAILIGGTGKPYVFAAARAVGADRAGESGSREERRDQRRRKYHFHHAPAHDFASRQPARPIGLDVPPHSGLRRLAFLLGLRQKASFRE